MAEHTDAHRLTAGERRGSYGGMSTTNEDAEAALAAMRVERDTWERIARIFCRQMYHSASPSEQEDILRVMREKYPEPAR